MVVVGSIQEKLIGMSQETAQPVEKPFLGL
jgi:hypothetical protein